MTNSVTSLVTQGAAAVENIYDIMIPVVIAAVLIGTGIALYKRFVPSKPRL